MNGKRAAAFAVVRVVIYAATFLGLVYILILNRRKAGGVACPVGVPVGVCVAWGHIPPPGGDIQPPAGGEGVA